MRGSGILSSLHNFKSDIVSTQITLYLVPLCSESQHTKASRSSFKILFNMSYTITAAQHNTSTTVGPFNQKLRNKWA